MNIVSVISPLIDVRVGRGAGGGRLEDVGRVH